MATFLYRLGRTAFRRRWYVALIWVAVLAAVGFGAAKAPATADDSNSMPGIESQKAFDLMEQRFPGTTADGANARIVFVAPDGQKITAADNKKTIEKLVDHAADGSQVASAVSPFQANAVSKDATTAYATVTYKVKADDLTDASKNALKDAIAQAKKSGLTVEAGGTALATQPSAGGSAEAIGIAIAAAVLIITFGSLTAAGLPLLTAIIGVGVSMAAIMALSSALGLSSTTGTLATMLGLACGIDYAVFIVSATAKNAPRATPRGKPPASPPEPPDPPSSSPASPSSSPSSACPSSASPCSPRWASPPPEPSSSASSSR